MCARNSFLAVVLSGATLFLTSGGVMADDETSRSSPACAAAQYRQFDFWLGDWDVTEAGKRAGANRIERWVGGCALLESWTGASGNKGHSINYYNPGRDVWHQTWVDQNGLALELEGRFADGRMTLAGERIDPQTKTKSYERITWSPNADGSVRQLWESSADGKTWTVSFDGHYVRRPG